jgi:hypothetical protein
LSLFTAVEAAAQRLIKEAAAAASQSGPGTVMLWVKTQTVKNAAPRGRGAEDDELILSDQRYHEGRLQG